MGVLMLKTREAGSDVLDATRTPSPSLFQKPKTGAELLLCCLPGAAVSCQVHVFFLYTCASFFSTRARETVRRFLQSQIMTLGWSHKGSEAAS